MKSKLMKRAWNYARQGQQKHGGSVKSYFQQSLKMAWEDYKENKSMKKYHIINVVFDYNGRLYNEPWGAVITLDDNNNPSHDFSKAEFLGSMGMNSNIVKGDLMLMAQTGDVIAIGQKDKEGNDLSNDWFIILDGPEEFEFKLKHINEHLMPVSPSEAVKYLSEETL